MRIPSREGALAFGKQGKRGGRPVPRTVSGRAVAAAPPSPIAAAASRAPSRATTTDTARERRAATRSAAAAGNEGEGSPGVESPGGRTRRQAAVAAAATEAAVHRHRARWPHQPRNGSAALLQRWGARSDQWPLVATLMSSKEVTRDEEVLGPRGHASKAAAVAARPATMTVMTRRRGKVSRSLCRWREMEGPNVTGV